MDTVKVARDYFVSSQSSLLIPNREYGARKFIQVTGLPKTPLSNLHLPGSSSSPSSSSGGASRGISSATPPSSSSPSFPPSSSSSSSSSSSGRGRLGKFLPSRHSDSSLPLFSKGLLSSSSSSPSFGGGGGAMKTSNVKTWLHPPEALSRGELSYNVKFLGECAVDQPKGTEVVKDAIRKRKFDKQIKRAEGQKSPKVHLVISVDGVRVELPKSRVIIHEYPLHRISYCADDKSDKKMFTFIAKAATTSDHYCYVFNCSDKSAEEITLTVGQAFDMAYRRFLDQGNQGNRDYKKQCPLLQRRVNSLQFENDALRKRVTELEKLKDRGDLEEYMKNNQMGEANEQQQQQQQSLVGRRLENLILEEEPIQSNGSGTSTTTAANTTPSSSAAPVLSPPPQSSRQHRQGSNNGALPARQQSLPTNPFLSEDATTGSSDPFGMGDFNPSASTGTPAPNNNGASAPDGVWGGGATTQQELMDIQAGFSRGLSFGTDDFSLGDLDPLNQGKQ